MNRILTPLALMLALSAGPLHAQNITPPPEEPTAPEELGVIERSLGAIIGQLFGGDDAADPEGQPNANDLTQDLSGALRQMGPVLRDLATQVDDVRNYQAPERLPNGDILIRRREGAPPPPPMGETLQPDDDAAPDAAPLPPSDQPQIAL
ncbi:hypothetical protein PANO111632_01580 [Paracoccus nototheniae]|uniref:AAA+ family ATPase n=1 Tax=Paracoccus nototheniae TaxID=2489002 RepID=A0ABW4DYY0_9RHOB|nr:hypothetical protein [Paracoccus nototheniae]